MYFLQFRHYLGQFRNSCDVFFNFYSGDLSKTQWFRKWKWHFSSKWSWKPIPILHYNFCIVQWDHWTLSGNRNDSLRHWISKFSSPLVHNCCTKMFIGTWCEDCKQQVKVQEVLPHLKMMNLVPTTWHSIHLGGHGGRYCITFQWINEALIDSWKLIQFSFLRRIFPKPPS